MSDPAVRLILSTPKEMLCANVKTALAVAVTQMFTSLMAWKPQTTTLGKGSLRIDPHVKILITTRRSKSLKCRWGNV